MGDDWLARSVLRTRTMHAGVIPDPVTKAIAPGISPAVNYAASLGLTRTVVLYCDTADLQRTSYRFDEAHLARYREWAKRRCVPPVARARGPGRSHRRIGRGA